MTYRRPTIEEVRAARARLGSPPLSPEEEAAYVAVDQAREPVVATQGQREQSWGQRFDDLMTRIVAAAKDSDPMWRRPERLTVRGRTGGKFDSRISAEGPMYDVYDTVIRDVVFWLGMEPEFVERIEEDEHSGEFANDPGLALSGMMTMVESGLLAVYDENTWRVDSSTPRRKKSRRQNKQESH